MKPSSSLALVLALAAPASAEINVPGDFATVQEAIDAATPGELIIVHGGVHGPIRIDKPLTIQGVKTGTPFPQSPLFKIDPSLCCPVPPVIELVGPGSGEVVLAGIRTDGVFSPWGSAPFMNRNAIRGSGFDALYIFDSNLLAPTMPSDGMDDSPGIPAVDVWNLPYVYVRNSQILGSDADSAEEWGTCKAAAGGTGLIAKSSTVVVSRSQIVGGQGAEAFCTYGCNGTAPGGMGAEVGVLILTNEDVYGASFVLGGQGGDIWSKYSGYPYVPCAKGASGVDVVGTVHNVPFALTVGKPVLGKSLSWSWVDQPNSWSSSGLILISLGDMPATLVAPFGWLVVAPPAVVLPMQAWETQSFLLPNDSALVGVRLAFQILNGSGQLSNPVVESIQP